MSISVVRQRPMAVTAARSRPGVRRWDVVAVAVLTATLSAAGAARPSLWFDEAATLSAATRSVPQLWRMVGNIDAVHGLYYLLMHGWYAVFPTTEFASRLSSALAAGLAGAGVVVLGNQLSTRTVAVTAGVVFAILPRVTWAGMETRSYALSMAVAVWLTVFCVRAARRGRPWWWSVYAALLMGATLLNVFLVLIVPAHAVVVAMCARRPRTIRYWAVAVAAAAAATVPFLLFAQSQLFQVQWISPLGSDTVGEILQEQYFDLSLPAAVVGGLILAAAVAAGLRLGADRPGPVFAVTLTWIAAPTAALLVYSVLRHPIYYPRYLSFTVPAFALLLGLAVVTAGRSRAGIAVILTCLATAAAPNYLAQRGPYAKAGMDYSAVADVIGRHASPGDCLVLDNSTTWKPGPIRPLTAARPEVYQTLRDYGRGRTALQRERLWDSHIAVWAWADKMPDCAALWTVTERDPSLPDHQRGSQLSPGPRLGRSMAYQVPSRFGFGVVERWQFSFAQVTKSIR
ncbi:MAG: glycosyltransferase family 39 protein [Actinomycetota bacterium]|nr:glycosyltransferase family 39 protein [Actinomycetota bacterium]MDA2947590.1 glycosyltransferase family 39 protein [Actinomycetota bacterium]